MTTEQQPCNFRDPETLKDVLELLAKLGNEFTLDRAVPVRLERDEAKKYFNVNGGSHDDDLTTVLGTVFTNAQSIRGSIISDTGSYGKYSSLDRHEGHDDCVVRTLKACLPKAYAALLFMFFNCDSGCYAFGGGRWKDQKVNGSGGPSQDLNNWLTKEKTLGSEAYAKPLTPGLIKRGFSDRELHTNKKGSEVATAIKTILKHDSTAALQNALSYLLPVCDWHPSLLGHAICFLSTFCSKVNNSDNTPLKSQVEKKFSGKSEYFKNICDTLVPHLEPFLNGSAFESESDLGLRAVSQQNQKLFDSLWDDGKFDAYVNWLNERLPQLIEALQKMSTDCKNWGSPLSYEMGGTAGPFLYGFVFKDNNWQDRINENLQGPINELTTPLNSLLQCLNGDFSANSEAITQEPTGNSGAAAAGAATGVISLGGAGFGAAYGFNPFGLKDIMSGVFGAIRGLVVGF
ncbi:secreted antigen 3 [Babesia divergens]|uniref:Secreted antigen 3 n=1 Tax=Babesia divergens TaxID=32595 RepID=A0AAD9LJ47_BABDI|nr:secreted antigen 3 [Babesia divergens]